MKYFVLAPRLPLILFFLIFSGCASFRYPVNQNEVKSSIDCVSLFGRYEFDLSEYSHYNGLYFWHLEQYDVLTIDRRGSELLFVGLKDGKIISSYSVKASSWECSGGVLAIDLDNYFENSGGVSVHQSRWLQIYAYQTDEAIARFKEISVGLFFLVPVWVSGDSIVKLIKVADPLE